MTNLAGILSRLANWQSVLDVLLVTLVIYGLLRLLRGTPAVQLLRGLLVIALVIVLITNFFQLTAFSWLIRNSIPALLVAIPVIFQPELRRALERLGRTTPWLGRSHEELTQPIVTNLVNACEYLSDRRHGALIILEGETGLAQYAETGVQLDAILSEPLLLTIFFPSTALHDGAVVVRENRLVAASCVLPLTTRGMAETQLGTRHRAAVGITEQTDALAIVVSEETGVISVARNGRMVRRFDERRLRRVLQNFYRPRRLWEQQEQLAR